MPTLLDTIDRREAGICLYGLAPPKLGTEPSRLAEILERQSRQVASLKPDGLIVYDLQNEASRNADPRPFPFLPTLDPDSYAHGHSPDILEQSVRLCEETFDDVLAYARAKGLPVGVNVESVSIRRAEIEASLALFRSLRARF